MTLVLRLSCMPKVAYTVVLQAATMAATNQAPSMEEESEAAKALWEITNSPGLVKKGPSCLTPRGPSGREHLLGFPTPQGVGHGSPSINYNRFFSPSQFSWSPLPGHSPAPQANATHPSHGNHSSSSMPSFFSSLASTTTTATTGTGTGAGGDEATAAADKAAAAALYAVGGEEGEAGCVVKKKAYSKKLDFAGPSSEKASRVWLSLDTETQRVARTGPRAAPPASPAVAGGGKDSQFFVTQSPFKYQGDGLEDFFASATGSSSSGNGSGSNSNSSSGSSSSRVGRPGGEAATEGKGQDAADLLLQDLSLDLQQKWDGGFEGGREGGQEEGQLQAVELLTDETSRMSSCGSVDSRGLPFTPVPVNAITMNQHGGSNWGGIQVRVKKTTPNHTHHQHDPSLLEALAAMLPLHDDASHSPSLPSSLPTSASSNSSYHSSMPPPQSPRTTTATSRGKFAPGSPVLEAMAMVTLSQSPSVFSSDRKKKRNPLRAPHSAPRVLIPSGSSIGSTSFSSLSSNITITNAAATAAAAAGATHPYQTPNSATKKTAHLVAAGKKNSPDSSSCSCKKSRCLKLYCECFRGGFTCGAACKCQNCANIPEFEVERAEAREKIEEKKRRKSGGVRQSLERGEGEGMVSYLMATSPPVLAEAEVEEQQQQEQQQEGLLPMSLSHSHATRRSTRCAGVPPTTTGGNIVFTLKQPSSSSYSATSSSFSTMTMTPVQQRKGKRKGEDEDVAAAAAAAAAVLSKPLRRTTPSKGGRKDEFLLSVFGPRSKINKQNSLEVLSYLDRDDMADACLVSSLWNRLALETLDE